MTPSVKAHSVLTSELKIIKKMLTLQLCQDVLWLTLFLVHQGWGYVVGWLGNWPCNHFTLAEALVEADPDVIKREERKRKLKMWSWLFLLKKGRTRVGAKERGLSLSLDQPLSIISNVVILRNYPPWLPYIFCVILWYVGKRGWMVKKLISPHYLIGIRPIWGVGGEIHSLTLRPLLVGL